MLGMLTACMALVRPVGMPQSELEDWLRVAGAEVADLPFELLDEACRVARRTCTHHSQIVPTIIRESAEHMAILKTLAAPAPWDEVDALPAPPIIPPTADDLHELQAIIDKAADKFREVELDRWAERRAERAAQYPRVKVDPDAPRTLTDLTAKWDAERTGEEGDALQ